MMQQQILWRYTTQIPKVLSWTGKINVKCNRWWQMADIMTWNSQRFIQKAKSQQALGRLQRLRLGGTGSICVVLKYPLYWGRDSSGKQQPRSFRTPRSDFWSWRRCVPIRRPAEAQMGRVGSSTRTWAFVNVRNYVQQDLSVWKQCFQEHESSL